MPRIVTEAERNRPGLGIATREMYPAQSTISEGEGSLRDPAIADFIAKMDPAMEWMAQDDDSQQVVTELALRYENFIREEYPQFQAAGFAKSDELISGDPMDYSKVESLYTKLKAFLSFYIAFAKGPGESQKMSKDSALFVAQNIIKMMNYHLESNESPDAFPQTQERFMVRSQEILKGVNKQVMDHCNWLIKTKKLLTRSSKMSRVQYSRNEVELILHSMLIDLYKEDSNVDMILQEIVMVQLCYAANLQIGSLCKADPSNNLRPGIMVHDVEFTKHDHGVYLLQLNVRTLKAINKSLNRRELPMVQMACEIPANLHLEVSTSLLILLMRRGFLKESGKDGKYIKTLDDLFQSNSAFLIGTGDGPLFRHFIGGRPARPQTTRQAIGQLRTRANSLMLPMADFHHFKQEQSENEIGFRIKHGEEFTRMFTDTDKENAVKRDGQSAYEATIKAAALRAGSTSKKDKAFNKLLELSTKHAQVMISGLMAQSSITQDTSKCAVAKVNGKSSEASGSNSKDVNQQQHAVPSRKRTYLEANLEADLDCHPVTMDHAVNAQGLKIDKVLENIVDLPNIEDEDLEPIHPGKYEESTILYDDRKAVRMQSEAIKMRLAWMQLYYQAWDL